MPSLPSVTFEKFIAKLSTISEQSSPFRRWTTGGGAGSSYRHHHDNRNIYNKQMSEGSTPSVTHGGGGVSRWSLGLEQLLADQAGADAFAHFLAKEFAAENIRFWWACEQFSSCQDPSKREELAQEIWQRHLKDGAPEAVNVDAAARRATALRLNEAPVPLDLFQQAQKQIFNVMKFDSYPRFLRSGVHAECARADLCGLPPPYAPRPDPPSPIKLKKSASNASERRRSGGAGLLPWRLRPASRDRGEAPPVTDVVKSSQNSCSLCRVVLPDGATSVVGVDTAPTVRQLVDRLLVRRNLQCSNYDVLLKDGEETKTIDPSSSSTVLSGREVTVERRCVVRVEVAGRCVAVRCRPQRRAAHVLKPVLARYLPNARAYRLLRDARPLRLDTPVTDLDGAKLLIIELTEGSDAADLPEIEINAEKNEDLDALSELALRLHDDRDADAQSAASSAGRSETGSCGAGAGAGRVRAALRPGPNLHHHPPDFLDNLHAAQRLRLGDRPPRSPPPLPPKPAQRLPPTLV